MEWRESPGGRTEMGKAMTQLCKVTSYGLNTAVTASICVRQDQAGVRQMLETSREGTADLWPHTTNKLHPLNKPACLNMGIRTLFASTWQQVLCLHHPGRSFLQKSTCSVEDHLGTGCFFPATSTLHPGLNRCALP